MMIATMSLVKSSTSSVRLDGALEIGSPDNPVRDLDASGPQAADIRAKEKASPHDHF